MAGERRTVLVTGGSGFLGGWCVAELLARGYTVRTTVRDPAREPELRSRVRKHLPDMPADADDRLSFVSCDLTSDAGWEDAVAGARHVLHVASPFPLVQPKDPDQLIAPARDGTLRVLRAALGAGAERVVVTSLVAAVGGNETAAGSVLGETDWTDLGYPGVSAYARSKTIAEQAAWAVAEEMDAVDRLAVVNPGAILGPVEGEDRSPSLEVVGRLLKGVPGIPRIGFNLVDVRDVADLEIRAMSRPEAGGRRFVGVTCFRWMAEVAEVLRERLGEDDAKVPTRRIPDLAVRAMGIFDPGVRAISGQLGRKQEYSSALAEELLGWSPRAIEETIADCGLSMVRAGS